jgi:hypothetical protein
MAMMYKESPEEPEDFGFVLPWDYLRRVCPLVIASSYVTLPRAGGLDDQDPLFLDDLDTYLRLKYWAEAEAKGMQKQGAEDSRGFAFDEL